MRTFNLVKRRCICTRISIEQHGLVRGSKWQC